MVQENQGTRFGNKIMNHQERLYTETSYVSSNENSGTKRQYFDQYDDLPDELSRLQIESVPSLPLKSLVQRVLVQSGHRDAEEEEKDKGGDKENRHVALKDPELVVSCLANFFSEARTRGYLVQNKQGGNASKSTQTYYKIQRSGQ